MPFSVEELSEVGRTIKKKDVASQSIVHRTELFVWKFDRPL
jgi:hypothetical protein